MKYLSLVLNWGLGSVFLLIALLAILNSSVLAGVLLLGASLILIPVSRELIFSRLKIELTPVKRAGVVAVLIVGFLATMGGSEPPQQAKDTNPVDEKANESEGGNSIDAQVKAEEEKATEKASLVLLKENLDYPRMGTPYNDIREVCEDQPSSSQNEEGHYDCAPKKDSLRGTFVFGPDRKLKARLFNFSTGPGTDELLSMDELLAALDERYGERAITQTGTRRFNMANQSRDVTAVSYGCKAYYFNKPGMDVPGGTPRTHQTIWIETGMVLSIPGAERFDFEVIKSEVQDIDRCIVALAVFGGLNIPRGIDEEQKYISRVDVLEVDPSFNLLASKHW